MADPQVPSIAPVSAPQSSGSFDSIMSQVSGLANAELPPQYIKSTTLAEPKLPRVEQYQPLQQHNQPITGQVADVKRARRENSVAGLANMIGKFGQQMQQKRQDLLKEDLKSVMQARTNIANAKTILAQDSNNADAKAVLEKNNKSLEAIMTDPRKHKQLEKALDISFVDMEKNKTPEIQAYQQAKKEVEEAEAFSSNNPQEHKISMQALAPGGEGVGHNTPPPQAPPASQTPHADAVTAKDLPGMQENPNYQVALKQKEEAQKRMEQYVIPAAIRAETAQQVEALKQGNANARAEYNGAIKLSQQAAVIIAKHQDVELQAKTALTKQAMADRTAMLRTQLDVNAKLKIAEDKRLDPAHKSQLETQALSQVDKSIQSIVSTKTNLDKVAGDLKQQLDSKVITQGQYDQLMQQNKMQQDYANVHLESMNAYRLKVASKIYGNVAETKSNASSSGSTSSSTTVGTDLSDEDEDDDSDDYGDN